jgi:hypothetical protein
MNCLLKLEYLLQFCMYLNNPDLVDLNASAYTTNGGFYFWRNKNKSVSRMSVCAELQKHTAHLKYLQLKM